MTGHIRDKELEGQSRRVSFDISNNNFINLTTSADINLITNADIEGSY